MPTKKSDAKLTLSRDRILTEAIAFADEFGTEALSMRKLAERLDVGAMSLYRHVANKDEMIEAMLDVACRKIEPPVVDGDWQHSIRTSSASAHRVLLDHEWMAGEWTNRRPGPARIGYMEAILKVLTEAGLDSSVVYRGYHAITMHIVGFTIQQLSYKNLPDGEDLEALATEVLTAIEGADLPYLTAHVQAHVAGDDHGDEFVFVLDLILDGLSRASSGARI
jgi:AcrR family transcriptional regulator